MTKLTKLKGPIRKVPATRKVYAELREQILTLKRAPGSAVDEASLAEEFGVSRSPVREALIRLEHDRLIVLTPNKGTIIAPLQPEAFPQFIDALDLVQRAVTRLAAKQRTDEDLEVMFAKNEKYLSAVEELNVIKMMETNSAFHLAIAAAANNPYLYRSYEELLTEGRRIRLHFHSYFDNPSASKVRSHADILSAIENKDEDLAEKLAREHTSQLTERFIEVFTRRLTTGIRVDAESS